MSNIDLFLGDEGQQYGNMEEAASVARNPAKCLEVWSGEHRQTPGGLKKSKESKSFRKKLTKRPLALRGQTRYVQQHETRTNDPGAPLLLSSARIQYDTFKGLGEVSK